MKRREDKIKSVKIFFDVFKSMSSIDQQSSDSYWLLSLNITLIQKAMQDSVQGDMTGDQYLKKLKSSQGVS